MKKKLYLSSLFVLILFVPETQNVFAQRILQDWIKNLKAVPPANQYSARAGLDYKGDAYWAVNTQDSVTLNYTIHLVKYDTLGHLLWMDHYAGMGGLSITDFKTLSDGTTYTYGIDYGSGLNGTQACFLQKNDGDGNLLWSLPLDLDPSQTEYPDQIYISPVNGDILLTAYETEPQYNLILARYTPDGNFVWQTSVVGYEAGDIIMDENDNIDLLGTYHWGSDADQIQFGYLKFDGQGTLLSFYKHTGGGASHALATAGKGRTIGLDNEGNVYALCWVEAMPGSDTAWTHIMINKFNSDGSFAWKKRLEKVKKGYPKEVATLLTDGATGESIVIGGWGLWKYDTDGNYVSGWHDSRRNYIDGCQYNQQEMFTLSSGNLVVDGDSGKLSKFDWSDAYNSLYEKGRGNMQPLNNTAIVEPDMAHNAMYVTWSFNDSASLHRVVLRNAIATGVSEVEPLSVGLNVYPNPANESTNISFLDDLNSSFALDVYNVNGVRVAHELYPHGSAISFNVKNLTPGVYQIIVTANGKQYQDKFVVMR